MYAFVFLFFTISNAVRAQTPKPSSSPSEAKADEMSPGLIVLTAFEGDVKIASAKNPVGIPPSAGAKLQKGDIILTGPNSSASLAFSNGSVLQVQSSSKFSLEDYLQKPWDFDEAAFKKLEKEPTSSQTKLKLDYGDVICNVKKLSATSEMTVSTPLGVAGIRGTTFKLSVSIDSKGKPSASKLSVVEGAVALSSQGSGQAPLLVTSGLASSISVNPAADGTFTVVFDAPLTLTLKDTVAIQKIVDQVMKQIGEFVMSAITAQEEVKKKEDEKKSGEGEGKPEDGEKKEGDEKKTQIDLSKLPPPDTGAEKSSEKAALNAAASKAQAEIEAKAEANAKAEVKAKAEAKAQAEADAKAEAKAKAEAEAKAEAGANKLSGFALSADSVTYGDNAPVIKAPTSNFFSSLADCNHFSVGSWIITLFT